MNLNKDLSIIIFSIFVISFLTGCSKTGHYEKGMELLSEKKYVEAISEFQKIDAGERDFRLAQSKIAYLQGLQAFNDSLFTTAEVQLSRVAGDDEYYHETQLMLDKIAKRKENTYIPKSDTIVIREEVSGRKSEEKTKDKIKADIKTDTELTKEFIKKEIELIEKFESLYKSAYSTDTESKNNYLDNMKSVSQRLNALEYGAKDKDAVALELKQKAGTWMIKRLEFISKLIKENSVKETNSSRSLKEEGDKLYYGVTQLMKKVN